MREAGFPKSVGQRVRAIPQPEKGRTLTIVETRAGPGGVDTHADMHVAGALDAIGGCWECRSSPPRRSGMRSYWAG
jgi:hypothetical protein